MVSRRAFTTSAAAALVLASQNAARADGWPTGTISFVVPFPPGGSVDPIARMGQSGVQSRLGVNVIVENKPGASGSIGTGYVAHAKPDGGTFVFVFDTHSVNPFLQKLPFDTEKDLDPVLWIGMSPNVLATHPASPYNNWADVMAAAKANPGKLTFGSIGTGSLGHLAMLLLTKRAGIEMTHVPYKGGGPLMNDALAGHVDLAITSAAVVGPQIAAGKMRPLMQMSKERLANLKGVPTAIESGFPDFESVAWWGVFAPKGTPEPLKAKLREALVATYKEPGNLNQLTENMQVKTLFEGPEALAAFVSKQMAVWGAVARENNVQAGQ